MRDWDVDGPLSVVCSLKSVSCCLMREPGTSPSVSGRLCVCVSQWWCVLPQKGNRKNSLEVYWDSSPDMSLLTLPSLNTLTHTHKETHTDTLGHGWYHLHLQLTHSLGLSGDTQARAPRAFPECQATRTHTQKHTQRCCPSRKGLDFHRIWFFFCILAHIQKNIDFNSKKKWSTVRWCCFEQIANAALSHQASILFALAGVLSGGKFFFFLKFRLFRWSLRVTETKTLQEAFKKKQLLEFSCVNLNPFVLIQRPVICSSEQWKQPSTGTTNWPCLNLWTNQRCGWQLRCLEPEPARLQRVLLQTHFPLLSVRLLWSPTPLLSSIMITLIPGNHCVKQQTHVDSDVDGSTKGRHFAFWSREVI